MCIFFITVSIVRPGVHSFICCMLGLPVARAPEEGIEYQDVFLGPCGRGEKNGSLCGLKRPVPRCISRNIIMLYVLFRLLNCCCLHLAFQWLLAPFEFASRTEENLARLCFLLAYGGSCSLLTKDCGRNAGAVALQFPATFWQCIHSCRFHLSSIVARDSFAHCTSFVAL